jgi:hypothetical protein
MRPTAKGVSMRHSSAPQWQSPNQSQAPEKKRHVLRWVAISVGAVAVLVAGIAAVGGASSASRTAAAEAAIPPAGGQALAPCGASDCLSAVAPQTTPLPADADPASHTVVYAVSGTARHGDLTYATDDTSGTVQEQDVQVPWTKTLPIPDSALNSYQLTAQNTGSGSITCTVTVDGTVVKTVTASGAYATANCSASN